MEIVESVPRGLRGVVVTDTEIGDVRGEEGFFHYRQYSAIELAATRPFDDVWRLLVDGELPRDVSERERFAAEVTSGRGIPGGVRAALPAIAAASSPLDGLRTALSLVASSHGLRPVLDLDHEARRRDALVVAAVTPTLVAALHRVRHGHEPVEPRPDLGTAANLLWMLHGTEPDAAAVRALEQYLIATIDHGFNASTFTARVVASTGADVGACVVAAIGALSGPLHGGAPSRALDLLDEIGEPGRARDVVTAKVLAGERIMGFGHAVYRTDDPRSLMLREIARHLGGPLVDLALEVERTVVDVLAELKPGRRLRTNVEFYAGVVMATCGIPRELFTPTFASSRVVGWVANVLEQAADPTMIRPAARYIGPRPPAPVPVLHEPSA
jgi:citrate synthase